MAEVRGLKALENWVKRVTSGYNGVHIKDMTSSFRDGLAFCAIIHHYYPDLIDFESLSKENILHNNSLAFNTAEKQLGVPALLDAEDMVQCEQIDRLSIYTYLSQLRNCFENQNRVNNTRLNVKRIAEDGQNSIPAKVPFITPKNAVGRTHELCQACQHRVFILERLMVSGKLYHRTCFKCCKCKSILNPGAYVEGDQLGTYECAVCPKDEATETVPEQQSNLTTVTSENSAEMSTADVKVDRSPLPSPKTTPLLSPFNKARSFFLQKSIENVNNHQQRNFDAPISGHSSIDSFSMSVDEALENAQLSESETSDGEIETPSEPSPVIKKSPEFDSFRSLPDTALRRDPVSSYQSPFTREALQTTSLKTSFLQRRKLDYGTKSLFDIPYVKPTTASLPSHIMPRPSSTDNFQSRNIAFSTGRYIGKSESDIHEQTTVNQSNLSQQNEASSMSGNSTKKDSGDNIDSIDKVVCDQPLNSLVTDELLKEEYSKETSVCVAAEVKELIHGEVPTVDNDTNEQSVSETVFREQNDNKNDGASPTVVPEPCDLQDDKAAIAVTTSQKSDGVSSNEIKEPLNAEISTKTPDASEELLNKSALKSETTTEPILAEEELLQDSKTEDLKLEEEEIYPDDMNPFGDDEDQQPSTKGNSYPDTLNPFGDSDEEDSQVSTSRIADYDESKNPFASDDEEEVTVRKTSATKPVRPALPSVLMSQMNKTPNSRYSLPSDMTGSLRGTASKKRVAPTPPSVKDILQGTLPRTNSGSSLSSPASDQVSIKSISPKLRKNKKAAPPPPAQNSNSDKKPNGDIVSRKDMKDLENMKRKSNIGPVSPQPEHKMHSESVNTHWKKKRPAPPVPIPPRREIKKIPLKEIQSEMTEIEEKQIDLEKHGKELELLIRDKDKDINPTVEEEEYIMQLFELVNQKNALFRRMAELMYIKRSQRLEEEQVELEFQIRCLNLKPATHRTEADSIKEEELLKRLLDVVDQRNEIVDSIELDRKRENEEDVSVQEQMEIKNSDLPIPEEIKEKGSSKKKEKKHKEKKEKKKSKDSSKHETTDSHKKRGTLSAKKWF